MGLRLIVREEDRLPQLNAVAIPDGVDDAAVRARLLEEFNSRSARASARWRGRFGASG